MYAYKIYSEMTGDSIWFLSKDKNVIKSNMNTIEQKFENFLDKCDDENEGMSEYNELANFCKSKDIIMDFDGDVDTLISFELNGDFTYADEPIEIVGKYVTRF